MRFYRDETWSASNDSGSINSSFDYTYLFDSNGNAVTLSNGINMDSNYIMIGLINSSDYTRFGVGEADTTNLGIYEILAFLIK